MAHVQGPALYRALGTYRFALAFMVLVSHTWTFSAPGSFVHNVGLGNVAVMAFFILSGFIIAEAIDAFYLGRPGAFLANRALRLIPPYWGAVLVSICVHASMWRLGTLQLQDYAAPPVDAMLSWQNALVQLTAIVPVFNFNNILPDREWYYFVRFAWAIFVEFVFYGAVAACMIGFSVGGKFLSARTYCIACVVGALSVHAISEYLRPLHSSFAYIPYFAFGVCAYAAVTRDDWVAKLVAAVALFAAVLHFIRYTQGRVNLSAAWLEGLASPPVWTAVLLLVGCGLAIFPLSRVRLSSAAVRRDKWFGDLAYPLYLNHYAVIVLVLSLEGLGVASQITAVIGSLILAWTMKIAIERPMVALRNRIRGADLAIVEPTSSAPQLHTV